MERNNCWEVMKCGRQQGGENVGKLGICIAALPNEYDGVNKGAFGGRNCWVITGTLCKGEVQGTYVKKIKDCLNCKFLKQVSEEEGRFFTLTLTEAKDRSRRLV